MKWQGLELVGKEEGKKWGEERKQSVEGVGTIEEKEMGFERGKIKRKDVRE